MRTWQWVTIVIVALVALLAGAVVVPLLWGGYSMTLAPHASAGVGGYGGYGPGMMRGFGVMPFGLLGMLMMLAFPVGLLLLVVIGVVWLINAANRPAQQVTPTPAAPVKTCPNCQRPVQADWRNCPYCGAPLTQ